MAPATESVNCCHVNQTLAKKTLVKVRVNGRYLHMELDTGSSVSCMSRNRYDQLRLTGSYLTKCNKVLIVANGQTVHSVSRSTVLVKFRDIQHKLDLYVVESDFPTLFGRDWLEVFLGKDWLTRLLEIRHVETLEDQRDLIIQSLKNSPIFEPGMGKVVKFEATLDLKEDYRPKFCNARPGLCLLFSLVHCRFFCPPLSHVCFLFGVFCEVCFCF